MNTDLRSQALERMKQFEIHPQAVEKTSPLPSSPTNNPAHNRKSAEGIPALLNYLDLDRDRLILLSVLIFLYYDHASPKILLAILYIML